MSGMVEVHAIVRREMLDRVVHGLRAAGVPRLTVARVHAIGTGVDPDAARIALSESAEYADKAAVVFICPAARSPGLIETVIHAGRTGRRGDGIVYVQPVAQVVKIRTGVTGIAALQ